VEKNLLTNFRDTAKELKAKEAELVKWLETNKYIYRDTKERIKPYAQHVPALFEEKEYLNPRNNYVGVQTLITPKGRETFRLLLIKDGYIK
jgi:phage antirepressor YoqD-like protein